MEGLDHELAQLGVGLVAGVLGLSDAVSEAGRDDATALRSHAGRLVAHLG